MICLTPYRRRAASCALALALLGVTAGPSLAIGPLALAPALPDRIYAEHAGEIYWLDLASYRDTVAAFAAGEGSVSITMSRAVFHDSEEVARFAFGEGVPAELTVLGSEPRSVVTLTDRDPADARWSDTILTVTVTRRSGVLTTTLSAGRDRVELTLPESLIDGDATTAAGASLNVNGLRAELGPEDLDLLGGLASGQRTVEEAASETGLDKVLGALDDPRQLNDALVAFGLMSDGALPVSPSARDCTWECMSCFFSVAGTTASGVALALTGCGGIAGCAIWVGAHGLGITGAAGSCASCLDCGLGDSPGEDPEPVHCPPQCGAEVECPEGCPCPDGTLAGPQGCEPPTPDPGECNPLIDPDGCECPINDVTCLP
jgi:hypothetical protein